jgi:VWFA-related protein
MFILLTAWHPAAGWGCSQALLVLAFAAIAAAGQDPAQNSQQNPAREKPLVRVYVDLVQMDVVVTDAKGNHVSDLRPEEFEVLENGKPQSITNFSFLSGARVGTIANTPPSTPPGAVTGKGAKVPPLPPPPIPPARIAAGEATRTIAVVMDDLGIGEQSFAALHAALEKFIDQQVGPGDLVAIVTTSGRLGSLQCLTSDSRLLRAAVAKFRSIPNHRTVVGDDDFTCVYYRYMKGGSRPGMPQDEDAFLS